MSAEKRATVLDNFAARTQLIGITGVTQRGRDNDARFTMHTDAGLSVHLGTIDGLWSQTQFAKHCAVSLGQLPRPMKPGEWQSLVASLIHHVVEIEDATGETFVDTIAGWARAYADRATESEEGIPNGEPFLKDGELYLTATDLAKTIRREHMEQVSLPDIRQALRDLGAEQKTLHYRKTTAKGTSNSSVSYYRLELHMIGVQAEALS